ncbi:Anti-sigma-K factor RskA [Thalassovita litoralis]|jgi:anti-sigma-K factor RskA|uniref:Anti-sigma-K factor RskA n=1 Tax=Thalassovita litoralis TaxID=1010611 RepID=A0A521E6K2_9RHOB|nr:anti-sigma factor [Thalassovita litoralis]SMO79031.1 Anti-sigma-K factor RskA [Thalassovita litoralis]
MSQKEDHNDDAALAGEYVLHLLDGEELAVFEARLTMEPALRALVRDWDASLVALTDGIAPITPPAMVKDKLQAVLFPDAAKPKRSLWTWLAGGVAVAAIVVGAAFLTPSLIQDPVFEPSLTASVAAQDGTLVVAARFIAQTNALELTREAGAARPGRVLELWLIAEGSDAPVSLGVLPADTETRIELTQDIAQRLANGLLAISDEPLGGSPTGAPTGEVLAVGPVTNA